MTYLEIKRNILFRFYGLRIYKNKNEFGELNKADINNGKLDRKYSHMSIIGITCTGNNCSDVGVNNNNVKLIQKLVQI